MFRRFPKYGVRRPLCRPTSLFAGSETPPLFASSLVPKYTRTRDRETAVIFFANLIPSVLNVWGLRQIFKLWNEAIITSRVQAAIPHDSAFDPKILGIHPRAQEGGVFVEFEYTRPSFAGQEFLKKPKIDQDGKPIPLTLKEVEEHEKFVKLIEQEARTSLRNSELANFWELSFLRSMFAEPTAYMVKGQPWLDDLNRYPSARLRVEFLGPDIPEEKLYSLFRSYGRIHDILPPPASQKESPRFAEILYMSSRYGAAARNCLHGMVVRPEELNTTIKLSTGESREAELINPVLRQAPKKEAPTTLNILYTPALRLHTINQWMSGHPRIMLPIILALIGTLSWAIFDPIRQFFIKAKLEGLWESSRWGLVRWLKKETLDRFGINKEQDGVTVSGIEQKRRVASEELQGWLTSEPDTFEVILGPSGSGKTNLVERTIGNANVLAIDAADLCKSSREDASLVSELAHQVGYWPVFALASSINNMIDLASMGLIGQKAGFASSLEDQLKSILEVTTASLKEVLHARTEAEALEAQRSANIFTKMWSKAAVLEQFFTTGIRDGRIDCVAGNGVMSELGMGIERPDEDSIMIVGPGTMAAVRRAVGSEGPSRIPGRPIVVIKHFASKGVDGQTVLWDVLADWAASLIENKVAHVIFTTNSVSASKTLGKALPSKPFNTIALTDASVEAAIQYVESKLSEPEKPAVLSDQAKDYISLLGGRQTDLELLVQKVKGGLNPEESVIDIITKSAGEIRKNFFESGAESTSPWTQAEAWLLVKGLAKNSELKYADVVFNSPFKGDHNALKALEIAELITVNQKEGRPSTIKPGKPVYQTAFQFLLNDTVFSSSIEYTNTIAEIKSVTGELEAATKSLLELSQLYSGDGRGTFGGTWGVPRQVNDRAQSILTAMGAAETKLQALEARKSELLKVLGEEE